MNRKGFTLIELLIVVVIIGILAAIAIPKFANTKEKAYLASMKSDLQVFGDDRRGWGHLHPVDGQHAAGRRAHGGWLDGEHHQRRAEVPVSLRA